MPLIIERSFVSWAEKLARDLDEPLREIVRVMGRAVIDKELPLFFFIDRTVEPSTLPDLLYQVLPILDNLETFEWTYLGLGNDQFPPLKEVLDDYMIKDEDMRRWLRSRGVTIDEEEPGRNSTPPQLAQNKTATFKNWYDTKCLRDRPVRMSDKTLRKEFRNATGIDISIRQLRRARGFK
jgi:hypothetical protein